MTPPDLPWNARSLALKVLLQCRTEDAFVQDLLDAALQSAELSPPDRRLCTQLVYGVLRRHVTLNTLLTPFIRRDPHNVESWIWETLRIGAYQLALLSHIPAYAAIHQTVELATAFGLPRAKGFINGVLRAFAALVTDETVDKPAANAVPWLGRKYRRMKQPVLPEPRRNEIEYASVAFSLPSWLVRRWHGRYGWDALLDMGFWFAEPPPMTLRVNRLRTDRETLLALLANAKIAAEPGQHPQAIRLVESVPVRDIPGFEEGFFVVQDDTAMQAASALSPAPGSRVLDMCAAPGGKTTHLAELMRNTGSILACDIDESRLQLLANGLERLGIRNVAAYVLSPGEEPSAGPFDYILADVPCSNTGVLGRRPEVRWRIRPNEINRLVPQQMAILAQACKRLAPGGVVVYSTCSIEPEENAELIEAVRKTMPEMRFEGDEEYVPGRPADGGYWAKLRKK